MNGHHTYISFFVVCYGLKLAIFGVPFLLRSISEARTGSSSTDTHELLTQHPCQLWQCPLWTLSPSLYCPLLSMLMSASYLPKLQLIQKRHFFETRTCRLVFTMTSATSIARIMPTAHMQCPTYAHVQRTNHTQTAQYSTNHHQHHSQA